LGGNELNVKIEVTEKDISLGIPRLIGSCPVAKAIKRTIEHSICAVGEDFIVVQIEHAQHIFSLYGMPPPPDVQIFVRKFDRGEPVEPFSFHLFASVV
jgi:hypothetical protein